MSLISPRKCLLAYLLITAAAIIPQTLAQLDKDSGKVLGKFDLLLLTKQPKPSPKNESQSILLINERSPSSNVKIQLPKLVGESETYEYVTPDIESDTVYWTTSTGIVGYFGVNTKEIGVLYEASHETKLSDLTHAGNKLYWIEGTKSIKSMQVGKKPEILVDAGDKEEIHGLTVNHKTGTLYYSTWPTYSRTKAQIWSITKNTKTLIASNLDVPTSLSISNDHIHWVSNPPGLYFFIERLSLKSQDKSTVIVKQAHQHGSSLAVSCDKVFWTDVGGKRVWEVNDENRYNRVPGGRQVGEYLLRDQSKMSFVQVVAVPQDCHSGVDVQSHIVTEVDQTTSTPTTEKPHPKVPSTESASTSSESVEIRTTTATAIRLCSQEELAATCSQNTDVICIVFGKPLCLSQQRNPISEPPTTPEPQIISSTQEPETNGTTQPLSFLPPPTSSWSPEVIALISALSTLATVMSLISLYMAIRVRNLSQKPKIRRRVIVNTRTSESGSSSPASVCEMIDIENCCNMNVCETPCYERTLLQPSNTTSTCTTSTTQNGSTLISVNSSNTNWGGCGKKEDKKCLLR